MAFAFCAFSQQIPQLPQQFTANYVGKISMSGSAFPFSGMIFIDAIQHGAYVNATMNLNGVYILESIISPKIGMSTIYSVSHPPIGNPQCNIGPSIPFSQIPPLAIPPTATFQGNETVNGIPTQVWMFNLSVGPTYESAVILYVSMAENTVVRMIQTYTISGKTNSAIVDSSNTVLGPINSNMFDPPYLCNTTNTEVHTMRGARRRIAQELFFSMIPRMFANM